MCNLYRHKSSYQEVADLFKTRSNLTNMTEFDLEIFPDYPAPIVRNDAHGERELAMLRWGMPSPDKAVTSTGVNYSTTNIRNLHFYHWKKWLGKEFRCLVPAASFSEYGPKPDPVTKRKPLHWFALNEDQPCFALPVSGRLGAVSGKPKRGRLMLRCSGF
nr:SOS response-associated peptidase family protein [Phyllobacterium ifriqiyense]